MPKVYTYHESIPKRSFNDSDALIEVWKASWENQGWTPVVLGIKDAKAHPLYKRLNRSFEQLPSTNYAQYEAACFRRWLAMAQHGEQLMVDYDVINYSFSAEDFSKLKAPSDTPLQLLTLSGYECPCAVYSTNFTAAALLFASWNISKLDQFMGRKHVSDQGILRQVKKCYNTEYLCYAHASKGWETAPMVHYPNDSMIKHQPRSEWIPKLRPL